MKRVFLLMAMLFAIFALSSCKNSAWEWTRDTFHTHDFGEREDYDAEHNATLSCDRKIYLRTCKICGEVRYERGDASDHEYVQTEIPPTCTEAGEDVVYCKSCIVRTVTPIPAKGHTTEPSCDELYHWLACTECSYTEGKNFHAFGEDGLCKNCGLMSGDGILYTLSDDGTYAIVTAYLSDRKNVNLAESYQGVPVREIGVYVFGSHPIESITIPDSVVKIGVSAFHGCSTLKSVIGGRSVTEIGKAAFYQCSSLTHIELAEGLETIAPYAFLGCTQLPSIVLPEGTLEIENFAFYNCFALAEINLPESVRSIGQGAFVGCVSLSEITLPQGLEELGPSAFYECSGLSSIALPDSLKVLREHTFTKCASLCHADLGEGIVTVEPYAFYACTKLETVRIGASLTTVLSSAFADCSVLRTVFYTTDEPPRLTVGEHNDPFTNATPVKETLN